MDDLSGRKQFLRNFIVSWAMHGFIFIIGFVMPRQISDNLGMSSLGIWDLGWTVVHYLQISNLGMASSLNRYSSLYRASGEFNLLSKATTVVVFWQTIIAALVVLASIAICWSVSYWLNYDNEADLIAAESVLLFLGFTVAIKMLGAPAAALLTGYHRSDIQQAINPIQDVLLVTALLVILYFDGGLKELAIATFCAGVLCEIARWLIALRICPEAKVSFTYWHWPTAKKMFRFGGKSIFLSIQQVLIFQLVVFFLASYGSIAAIAVFSRSLALIRHISKLHSKFTRLFVPMTSGMIGLGEINQASRFILSTATYSSCVAFPFIIVLVFFGDFALRLWMGDSYANRELITTLALASAITMSQTSTLSVLMGFNAHGKVAISSLLLTVLILPVCLLVAFNQGWTALVAARIVAVALVFGRAVIIPFYLKSTFKIPISTYLYHSILKPILFTSPLIILMYFTREAVIVENWVLSIILLFSAGILTAGVYWKFMLDTESRNLVLNFLPDSIFNHKSSQ